MVIRRLNLDSDEEAAAAVALQRAAYQIEADLIGSRGMPGLHEGVHDLRAAAQRESLWGAFDAGRLAGIIGLEVENDSTGRAVLRIARLAVDPAIFRRGVGRALVRHAVLEADARALPLRVSTGAANAPGCALYAAEGFLMAERFTAPDGTPLVMLIRPRPGGGD